MDIRQALENAEKLFPGGKARYEKILANFYSFFGNAADIHLISAPGRVEIGGNHTDHQRGCVLAAAVNLDIMGACAKNGLNEIRILSEGYPLISVSLENLSVREADRNTSAALVRGIAEQYGRLYAKNGGPGGAFPPLGFDACVQSDIPAGSGVSSSGAFEVFIAACMNHLFFGGKISPEEMAQMGRYAENIHFGKPSGLMDQMTCATGGLVFIDFSAGDGAPFVKKLRAQVSGHALCIIEAGDSHEDLTADYAAITNEMRSVASFFGKEVLSQVPKEDFLRRIPALRAACGDRAVLRAGHFYEDNLRAIKQAQALERGDTEGFLKLVRESGASSFMYLQNVYVPINALEQPVSVALMLCGELLGGRGAFRVHGGGFAGTVEAFVPTDMLEDFKEKMQAILGEGSVHELFIRQEGAVRL